MIKTSKKDIVLAISFLFLFNNFFTNTVFAEESGTITGTGTPYLYTPTGGGEYTQNPFNQERKSCSDNNVEAEWCCDAEGIIGGNCPHWVLVDNPIYRRLYNNGNYISANPFYTENGSYISIENNYSGGEICLNDDYVVIAGNLTKTLHYSNGRTDTPRLIINNPTSTWSVKTKNIVLSEANSDPYTIYYTNIYDELVAEEHTELRTWYNYNQFQTSNYWEAHGAVEIPFNTYTTNDWDDPILTLPNVQNESRNWGFFAKNVIYQGVDKNMTYLELLEKIKAKYNINEENLAAFCYSMLKEDPSQTNVSATIKLNNTVYAGETTKPTIKIKTEKSGTGDGSIAINDAEVKVISSFSNTTIEDNAKIVNSIEDIGFNTTSLNNNLTLNENERDSSETTIKNKPVNVYDKPAGTYYCVRAAVKPASSKPVDENNWYVSEPDCKKIAKKPSLQVWGAGVYSAGKIILQEANKRLINGYYDNFDNKDVTVFGSFAEQNIVSPIGIINGFASGAATGNPGSTERTKEGLSGSFEGEDPSICNHSPLTMPNTGCSSMNNPGGGSDKPTNSDVNLKAFAESFKTGTYEEINGCEITLDLGLVPEINKTYISSTCDEFTISSDITYPNSYSTLEEIPKVIIYAEDNINIACNVTNIDAVLITKGNVNTCSNSNNENDEIRSNQLKINGAVITGKLLANRTYGAATGKYSGIPAEIIDFDVSLYLHNTPKVTTANAEKMETVYQVELSPRN